MQQPENLLVTLERSFSYLERVVPSPVLVKRGTHYVFRYRKQDASAAAIQKLARLISTLNASIVLLKGGFVQELGAMFRMMDEFNEDIVFLCQAIRLKKLTDLHKRYLEAFYTEEFDDLDSPLSTKARRSTISRRKIHAAIAPVPENVLNPSDTRSILHTLSGAFSGYVHGASNHILEMYGGYPPRYHLSGMLGTPRITEFADHIWHYLYRGLLSMMWCALAFDAKYLLNHLYQIRERFEHDSGKTEWEHPEKLVRRIKKTVGAADGGTVGTDQAL